MYKYNEYFRKAIGFSKATINRSFETTDIVSRMGVIAPNHVFLNNYPISNPIAVFNPALVINEEDAVIFARISVGYYMYVSAIVVTRALLDDIFQAIST